MASKIKSLTIAAVFFFSHFNKNNNNFVLKALKKYFSKHNPKYSVLSFAVDKQQVRRQKKCHNLVYVKIYQNSSEYYKNNFICLS